MTDIPRAWAVNRPGASGTSGSVVASSMFEGSPVAKELIAETR